MAGKIGTRGQTAAGATGAGAAAADVIERALREKAVDGRIACAAALALAARLGVAPREVGAAADRAGIHISACQLGCFR
jgi:phage-related tail protein